MTSSSSFSGLWNPNQQHVHHDRDDADDQRGRYEVVVERQRRQHHQNRPRVGPQVHGIWAGTTSCSRCEAKLRHAIYSHLVFLISTHWCIFFLDWRLQIKRLIGSEKESLRILERFVAGSLAGVIAQSTIYPMEVIIRLITSTLKRLSRL